MSGRPDWSRDGADWPNRASSRFVSAAGLTWHVQRMGEGPVLLLLHGTGAATHSWAGLLPLLARQFTVVAPDLPGHGFTGSRPGRTLSLPFVARAVSELMAAMTLEPAVIVGHSAGAAVAARMALDRRARPGAIISLNGALLPFPGMMQLVAPALAKLLFLNPLVPRLAAWRAGDPGAIDRLIDGTGSTIDARGKALYGRLFRRHDHAEAALAMMANWDLETLSRDLHRLAVPLTLVAAGNDRFTPPRVADEVARRVGRARVVHVPGLGHLAHEEAPDRIAAIIQAAATTDPTADASGSATAPAAPPGASPPAASDTAA